LVDEDLREEKERGGRGEIAEVDLKIIRVKGDLER
jgi:hypothetical protein